jgi:hypothetical protein
MQMHRIIRRLELIFITSLALPEEFENYFKKISLVYYFIKNAINVIVTIFILCILISCFLISFIL